MMLSSGDKDFFVKVFSHFKEYGEIQSMLDRLSVWWNSVSAVGKVNYMGMDESFLHSMEQTQDNLLALQDELLEKMAENYGVMVMSLLSNQAQNCVDILNRNLFERTADVGFLSQDEVLIEFLSHEKNDDKNSSLINQRLAAYVAKYSVYENIYLLNERGVVVFSLNDKFLNNHVKESWFFDIPNDDYLEYLGPTALRPEHSQALLYAHRILKNGRLVGYLVLVFKLEDELNRIFDSHVSDGVSVELIDDALGVFGHSARQIFSGTTSKALGLSFHEDRGGAILMDRVSVKPFQGFSGLNWQAQAYVDIKRMKADVFDLSEDMKRCSNQFPADIDELNKKVSMSMLVVLINGKILSIKNGALAFIPILAQFQEIGSQVGSIYGKSIEYMHDALLKKQRDWAGDSSKLLGDIIDRNLYERANDSRWWALDRQFQSYLSLDDVGRADAQLSIEDRLHHLNELYSIYHQIVLIDKEGCAVASSRPDQIGTSRFHSVDWFQKAMRLVDDQQYAVSSFEPSVLYAQAYTYIYAAPIFDGQRDQVLGCMAVVFDAAPQFSDMIQDIHGQDSKAMALFVQSSTQLVLASSHPDYQIGDIFDWLSEYRHWQNGQGSEMIERDGVIYAVGWHRTTGYREFKTADGYDNEIVVISILQA